jgi:hypothetical protein
LVRKNRGSNGPVTASIRDSLFGHAAAANNGDLGITPQNLHFTRDGELKRVTFYTDLDLLRAKEDSKTYKIAWLIESPEVHKKAYETISDPSVYRLFDLILTFDKQLLSLDKRFKFCPVGGCWIKPEDRSIAQKSQNVSIIASAKKDYMGQRLRHEVVSKFGDRIEGVFGRGYKPLDNKIEGLKDFRYSIVIENCKTDYYFTEKLIDCFVTGTVPIYWGCPDIGRFFDQEGIIIFNSADDLEKLFENLSAEDYASRLSAIKNNFEAAKTYTVTEDYIFNKIITESSRLKRLLKI